MAVTDVDVTNRMGSKDQSGERRTDVYRVVFDAIPTDIAGSVMSADDGGTAIPSIGDSYPGATSIKCKSIGDIQSTESRLVYEVSVNYDNLSTSSTVTTDPLSRPASIEWGFVVLESPAEYDTEGNRVENSAGDPYLPPIPNTRRLLTCTITRNVSSHDPADAFAKINTVNSAGLTIAGVTVEAGQALINDYSAVAVYDGSTSYAQQRFEIWFDETFDVEIGDMGYYYIDASDGDKRKHFHDGEGRDTVVPMYLDENGDDGGGTVRMLTWTIKKSSNFGALGLPTSFPDF